MNKKGQQDNPLMVVIILGMIILIGLAFITSTANTKELQTDKISKANEIDNLGTSCMTSKGQVNESSTDCNITVDKWYNDWRASHSACDLENVVVTNSTGTSTLTEGTDYNLYAGSGIIQMLNTSKTNSTGLLDNQTYTDYDYCGEGYLTSSGDRGLANLWTTMMIIVLIGAGVWGINRIWKNK